MFFFSKLSTSNCAHTNAFRSAIRFLLIALLGSAVCACEVKVSTSGESGVKVENTNKESDDKAEAYYNSAISKSKAQDKKGALTDLDQQGNRTRF